MNITRAAMLPGNVAPDQYVSPRRLYRNMARSEELDMEIRAFEALPFGIAVCSRIDRVPPSYRRVDPKQEQPRW